MEWLIFWIFCAVIAAVLAGQKGRSGGGWFCLGLFVGPFAWIVGVFPRLETGTIGPQKVCPFCAEGIRSGATKCRYCQSEQPIASEAVIVSPGMLGRLTPAEETEATRYVTLIEKAGYQVIKLADVWDIKSPTSSILRHVRTLAALRATAVSLYVP